MSGQLSHEELTDDDEFFRVEGDQAREYNISAAYGVAEAVRATYGPGGLDKMLVSSIGDIDVTNDGVTVLNGLDVDHPAAKVVVEAARTQRDEVGDGTTTAVLLAGTLLRESEELLEAGVHPTAIVDGFQLAVERALREVEDCSERVGPDDDEFLHRVATTSLAGKSVTPQVETILPLLLEVIRSVTVDGFVDFEYLWIETQVGRGIAASTLVSGVVLDEEPRYEAMPREVLDGDVLLIDESIQPEETKLETRASIDSHDRWMEFLDREDDHLRTLVGRIEDVDPDVVFSRHRIDERAHRRLADLGVLAVDNLERSDVGLEFLREVLDATIVSALERATAADLGRGAVNHDRNRGYVYVENEATHGASLVLRGGSEHIVDELERSARNALDVLTRTISDGRLTAGGGAVEAELASRLQEHANGIGGPQQLAVRAFANALEIVPRTLAVNAGHDPINVLTGLRTAHDSGSKHAGLDADTGEIADAFDAGIVEPTYVKEQAMLNATQVSNLILKIDGVLSAEKLSDDGEE